MQLPQHDLPSKLKEDSNNKTKSRHKKFETLYEINLSCSCGKESCTPVAVVDSKTIAFHPMNTSILCGDLTILMVELHGNSVTSCKSCYYLLRITLSLTLVITKSEMQPCNSWKMQRVPELVYLMIIVGNIDVLPQYLLH